MSLSVNKVSYCMNTFNRHHLLKNLIRSFDKCNASTIPYEWLIIDYGSTDGTREYLFELSATRPEFTIILANESHHIELSKALNVQPQNHRKKMHMFFGMSRNILKNTARGDLLIEIADDHQFIRKGDWVLDAISIINHRNNSQRKDDISSIVYRGLTTGRITKKNNETFQEEITLDDISYFVAKHKRYDDYHIQEKKKFNEIGPYFEVQDLLVNNRKHHEWCNSIDEVNHYTDYLERTLQLDLRKIFMKYPYVVDFPNNTHKTLNIESDNLIVPIGKNHISLDRMKDKFSHLNRAVSTEEMFSLV